MTELAQTGKRAPFSRWITLARRVIEPPNDGTDMQHVGRLLAVIICFVMIGLGSVAAFGWVTETARVWLIITLVGLALAFWLNRMGRWRVAVVLTVIGICGVPFSAVYFNPTVTVLQALLSLIWLPFHLFVVFLIVPTSGMIAASVGVNLALAAVPALYPQFDDSLIAFALFYMILIEAVLIIGAARRDYVVCKMQRAAHESAETQQRYRDLFEAAFEAVVIHRNGVILEVNSAAETMFGYTRAELIGRSLMEFVAPEFHETMLHVNVDPTATPYEARVRHKAGHYLWVQARGKPYLYRGEWVRVAAVHDIDHLKRAEAQQIELAMERERVAVLQRFIGDMSHDLRTPLSVIKTTVYLVERLRDQPDRFQRQVDILRTQADRLAQMLDDLLQMTRLDRADTSSYDFAWQPLPPLIQGVIAELQNNALRKNQTLTYQADADLPQVEVDSEEFKRMLKHLVVNAIAYTPDGGAVSVRAHLRPRPHTDERDWVLIEVRDTGVGISVLELPHIFERFYRADAARSAAVSGTGLGLTMARKIAEAHGGMIEVESEVGKGSLFRVSLPVLAAQRAVPAHAES